MRILNYLDDWLILAQSQDQLCEHRDWCSRTSASWALGSTGKRANSCRCRGSLFSVCSLDSVNQTPRLTQERTQSVLNCLNTFNNRTAAPLKQFKRLLGHIAAAAAVTPLGLLHMRPLQHWLHGRVLRWAWQSGTLRVQVTPACHQTFTLWSDLSFLWAGVPLEQISRHAGDLHIPGLLNRTADELSRAHKTHKTPSPDGPADLRRFGLAQVDLFASLETSHCQLFTPCPKEHSARTHWHTAGRGAFASIVDAITLADQAQGVPCPFRLRAHSTISVASSWALAHGASLTDICRAAGWATLNTFARFCSLHVEPVSSCVLTSNG